MEIKILYEDESVIALNKPSGLLVHPDGKASDYTLTHWIDEKYPELAEVGELQVLQSGGVIKRPGIVHRLDRDTSGVILVAKTKEAHKFLKEQFQSRNIEKVYNAVVYGKFGEDKLKGIVDLGIGRSANDFRKWIADDGRASIQGDVRQALTNYEVLLQKEVAGQNFAYVEVRPKTGRTHQIRVHMKALGHTVVCDKVYAPKMVCDGSLSCLGFNRLALHAVSISLMLPNHTTIKIESELPEEFENAKNLLKNQ